MGNHTEKTQVRRKRMNFIELVTEIIGALQIIISPFSVGAIIGFLIYLAVPGIIGFVTGVVTTLVGLLLGIFFWRLGFGSEKEQLIFYPEF